MYDYTNMTLNVSSLVKQIKQNRIKFDIAIQRGEVWDLYRKSLFIHSLLVNIPVEPLMFVYNESNKTYDVIQGKQRSLAVFNYVNNIYKLHINIPPVIDENGNEIEVARRKFSDLPEEFQDRIKEYGLTIWRFSDITQDEIDELFFRINNGKPLTFIEQTRTKMKSLPVFQSIAKHPSISSAINEVGKKKFIDEQTAIQIWIMLYKESPSFLAKNIRLEMEAAEVSDEQLKEINNALDYLEKLYRNVGANKPLSRKMKTRTHVISLTYMAFLAINRGIGVDSYIEKAKTFFSTEGKNTTISEAYNTAVGSGSAKQEQIRIRKEEIEKALE